GLYPRLSTPVRALAGSVAPGALHRDRLRRAGRESCPRHPSHDRRERPELERCVPVAGAQCPRGQNRQQVAGPAADLSLCPGALALLPALAGRVAGSFELNVTGDSSSGNVTQQDFRAVEHRSRRTLWYFDVSCLDSPNWEVTVHD